jgi:hypothetical protein
MHCNSAIIRHTDRHGYPDIPTVTLPRPGCAMLFPPALRRCFDFGMRGPPWRGAERPGLFGGRRPSVTIGWKPFELWI